jgi:hypothetical protein
MLVVQSAAAQRTNPQKTNVETNMMYRLNDYHGPKYAGPAILGLEKSKGIM